MKCNVLVILLAVSGVIVGVAGFFAGKAAQDDSLSSEDRKKQFYPPLVISVVAGCVLLFAMVRVMMIAWTPECRRKRWSYQRGKATDVPLCCMVGKIAPRLI